MLDDPSVELRRDAVQRVLDSAKTKESAKLYRKALDAARDVDQINIAKTALEDAGQKVDLPRHFWLSHALEGYRPFDNTERKGFSVAYPPEKEINFTKSYPGKDGNVKWSDFKTADTYGMVDINEPYGHLKEVVAYAHHTYHATEARTAEIRLGCKNAWKIWLNDKLVFERDEYHRGMRIDQYTLPVQLAKGKNTLSSSSARTNKRNPGLISGSFKCVYATRQALHFSPRTACLPPNPRHRPAAREKITEPAS